MSVEAKKVYIASQHWMVLINQIFFALCHRAFHLTMKQTWQARKSICGLAMEVSFAGKIIEPNGGFFPASHGDDFRRVSNFKTQ